MTKPEIEKLALEYFQTRMMFSTDQKEYLEFFKAGYLKGVEIEKKRCLEIVNKAIDFYSSVNEAYDIKELIEIKINENKKQI